MANDVRLGVVRELSARLGHALGAADRVLLHVDVATRSAADLKRAIAAYWSTFAVHAESRSAGLMPWEQSVLAAHVRPGDRLLLIGCGSGREIAAMVARGCTVVGVEPSADTLALARRSIAPDDGRVTLVQGFVEDVDLSGDFDVCWFSYFSYSYVFDRRRRVALLAALSRRLRGGGRIVVTCISAHETPRSRTVQIGAAAGKLVRSDWLMAPGDVFVRDNPRFRQFHYQHVFTADEVAAEARDAGLAVTASHPPEAFVLQRV